MKKLLVLLATSCSLTAATFEDFTAAIHRVETGGRLGAIIGDGGRALGPLQIHRACWLDSGIGGRYEDVSRLDVATEVMRRYLTRYARAAMERGDWATCARVWNGGPSGSRKSATLNYASKVTSHL